MMSATSWIAKKDNKHRAKQCWDACRAESTELVPPIPLELPSAALAYAAMGLHVFPVSSDKKPLTPHGFKDATTDPSLIREWYARWPDAGVGIATGASGLLVLDVDPRHGGNESLQMLEQKRGPLPVTVRAFTGGGGEHHYFQTVDGIKSGANVFGQQFPGLDIRAAGGYVVAPPSDHESGRHYRWEPGFALGEIDFAEFPLQWQQALSANKTKQKATSSPKPHQGNLSADVFPEGSRNNELCSLAGKMRSDGLSFEAIYRALLETNRERCQPPLEESEVQKIAESVGRYPAGTEGVAVPTRDSDPWSEPPIPWNDLGAAPDPFPIDALPTALREMTEAMVRALNVSPEAAAAATMGVASIAIGNRAEVQIKDGHVQHPNLYFLAFMGVGEKKSPLLRPVQRGLLEWDRARRPEYECALQCWKAQCKAIAAQSKGIEDTLRNNSKNDPEAQDEDLKQRLVELEAQIGEPPVEPCRFVGNSTSEAMARRMQANNGAIGWMSSEARGALEVVMGKYTKSGGDTSIVLNGHGYDFLRVDRQSAPSIIIERPCLSAILLTQPDLAEAMGQNPALVDSGFLARFLFVVPEPAISEYSLEVIPQDVQGRFDDVIRRLMEIEFDQDGKPKRLVFTPEALAYWKSVHDALAQKMFENRETVSPFLASWFKKLPEHVARFGCLFHMVRWVENETTCTDITEHDLEAPARIAKCLGSHARRAESLMGATLNSSRAHTTWQWIDKNRELLRSMRQKEGLSDCLAVKPRDLARYKVAGIKRAQEAKEILMELDERRYVNRIEVTKVIRGKQQELFMIRP